MYRFAARAGFALLVSVLGCTMAQAQLFRAYLSSAGADTNPCTLQQPCRLLPAALSAVASGGEIWMLDSANYNVGTVNVTKSVSIQAIPGQVGSILALGGTTGMVVSAASGTVGLRNLSFTNMATNAGLHGLEIDNASIVSVEDCAFLELQGQGIYAVQNGARVHVKNTLFRHLGGYAVWAKDGPIVDIANSHLLSTTGALVQSTQTFATSISISDSMISGRSNATVYAVATAQGGAATAYITRSTLHDMNIALQAASTNSGASTIYLTNSSVVNNIKAINISGTGATIYSVGNNLVADNALADTGTLTSLAAR